MLNRIANKIKSKIAEWEYIANSAKQGFTIRGLVNYVGTSDDYNFGKEYPFLAVVDKTEIDEAVELITKLLLSDNWNNVNVEEYTEITLSDYSNYDSYEIEDWKSQINEHGAFYIIYVESDV